METIGDSEIWSFLSESAAALAVTNGQVRRDTGHRVSSYVELAAKVAELQFRNWDYVLMFRGQRRDPLNQSKGTTLKPGIFRPVASDGPNPGALTLTRRFQRLVRAEQLLTQRYSQLGSERLQRHRVLRWSILQHYEVCDTPLLDVTHSLRISCSFASLDARDEAFIFVLGVPYLSGAITASAEAGLQIIRLASVCPPNAIRPHIQEGYLLGEYPEMGNYDQKALYEHYEIDFGRRLVAKFRFNPDTFWKKDDAFPIVEKAALYPNRHDPLFALAKSVKVALPKIS